jgi:outer membrane protein TolC
MNRLFPIVVCTILLVNTVGLHAQVRFSLQDAWDQALENRASGRMDQLDIAIANERVKQSYKALYPGISADIDFRNNLKLPTTIVPNVFNPNAGQENIAVQFGTRYNTVASLQLNYPILDLRLRDQLNLVKLNVEVANIRKSVNDQALRQEVADAYFAVLVNQERLRQLDSNLVNARKQADLARIKVEEGLLQQIEWRQLEVNYNNLQDEKLQMQQQYELSRQVLKLKMGMDVGASLDLDASALTDTTTEVVPATYQMQLLPRYRLSEKNIEIANTNALVTKKEILPVVSLYGFVGTQAQGDRFQPFNGEVFPWTNYYYIGAKLSWPLDNFFTHGSALSEARLQVERSEQELRSTEREIKEELLHAFTTEKNDLIQLRIASRDLAFAESNLEFVFDQFATDLVTTGKLSEAQDKLALAQTNYLIALFNYLTSKTKRKLLTGAAG